MSFVTNHRVDDKIVDNFYEKSNTQGSSANFTSEAPGERALIPWRDGTLSDGNTSVVFDLPFSFLLKQNQLEVFWELNDSSVLPVAFLGWSRLLTKEEATSMPGFDETVTVYYEELTASKVEVFNIGNLAPRPFFGNDPNSGGPGTDNTFLFSVPHTAKPAVAQDRVIIRNQGDNVGVELQGAGDGILLVSRLGKKFLLQIDEGGNLSRKAL